jgi:hypothetical protein
VEGLVLLVGLTFMIGSVLTFLKADFSQQGKKIFQFSKYIVIFMVASFVIHLLWITKGKVFSTRTVFHSFHSHKVEGDVYVNSYRHGIIKFDSNTDEFVKLNRKSRFSEWIFSVSGGKVAFLKDIQRNRQYFTNLWVMNADGSEAQDLTESHKKDSPFHEDSIRTCLLSPDGGRVAIISIPRARSTNTAILWWMDSDGKRLQKIEMSMPGIRRLRLIAWSGMDDRIFFTAEEKTRDVLPNVRLIKVELKTGDYQILLENILNDLRILVSPGNTYLIVRNKAPLEKMTYLVLLCMHTLEQKMLHSDVNLRVGPIAWNKDGNKIAFRRITNIDSDVDYKLLVYSVSDDVVSELDYGDYKSGLAYDWLADEDNLIVAEWFDQRSRLRILEEDLREVKSISLNDDTRNLWTLWGLDNAVLIQRSRRGGFWRLDLKTEEWKKVF